MMKIKNQNKSNLTLDERISNLRKQVMQNAIIFKKKINDEMRWKFLSLEIWIKVYDVEIE